MPVNIPSTRGLKSPSCKLTADQVRSIRRLNAEGMTYKQLALRFGLDPANIRRVCLFKSYFDVE